MTGATPTVPDPDDLPTESDVVGVYDYCDGDVVYCVADTTADGRWVAVAAGAEQPLIDRR